MKLIDRPQYINYIKQRLNKNLILVLIGQRRIGKSCILNQLKSNLIEESPENKVLYINKELYEFKDLNTWQDLYEYVKRSFIHGENNYLLIDEVQDISGYELALRSLHSECMCQIIVTGSNAFVFSSELSTRLSGRYIEIPIYGLDYTEFLKFHNLPDNDQSLLTYLRVGGLPGLCHFDISDDTQLQDYFQGVYNTIMVKDVITREDIRNVTFIDNLSRFVADNIGKPVSIRNISNVMKSQGIKVSEPLISTYITYLCKALIINQVARYDIHGKYLFEQNFKYYFADHGLRNYLCGGNIRGSIEKLIENVIYTRLVSLNYHVTVGMLRSAEIDFVAVKGSRTIYIQATYLLAAESTIKREFGNLMSIKDNYEKYVVSMDPVPGDFAEYPGIHHISLKKFLTDFS